MLKNSVIVLLVIALLFSFSAVTLAKAENNDAGIEIMDDEDGTGVSEIHFLPAVPDDAENNPSPGDHPSNPIRVAGS